MPCISIIKSPQSFYYRLLLAPVAHQRNQEGDAAGKKDDAATETKQVIIRKALRNEEDGADKK